MVYFSPTITKGARAHIMEITDLLLVFRARTRSH